MYGINYIYETRSVEMEMVWSNTREKNHDLLWLCGKTW
jgi:hypothetical protein